MQKVLKKVEKKAERRQEKEHEEEEEEVRKSLSRAVLKRKIFLGRGGGGERAEDETQDPSCGEAQGVQEGAQSHPQGEA